MTREQEYYDALSKAKAAEACADNVRNTLSFRGSIPAGLKDGGVYWDEVQGIVDDLRQKASAAAARVPSQPPS